MGHLDQFETEIPNDATALEEVTKWYQQGSGYPEALETLKDFITQTFIPDIKVISCHGGSCVTAQVKQLRIFWAEIHQALLSKMSHLVKSIIRTL